MKSLSTPSAAKGLTLIEIMIAASILAICAIAMTRAHTTSMARTQQSDEYSAAARAAREILEEVAATQFKDLLSADPDLGYQLETAAYGRRAPFRVYLNRHPNNEEIGVLSGLVDEFAGELVIVCDETKLQNQWAGDLNLDGNPDGVTQFPLPIDLNMDGDTSDDQNVIVNNLEARRYPVGVIVRWQGRYGEERYEQWTVISRY